jgi:hypothetical protein
MTSEAFARQTRQPPGSLLGELAEDHLKIRDLVSRLEHQDADWDLAAEELSNRLAHHRASGMESVIALARVSPVDHEQQVRLLLSAMRGMDQLTDRLRLPAHDPLLLGNILVALRGLEHEHERLETELLVAELTGPPSPTGRFDS